MADNSKEVTRIFLVRHGVTDQTGIMMYGTTRGIDLNDAGREQARLTAELLSDIHIDAIYSSPLERAYQTAEAINIGRDLTIITKDEIMDTDPGDWTGMTLAACAALPEWKAVQDTPSKVVFPGGESFVQLLERMTKAVADIVEENPGKNVVITCHRDPIIILLSAYLGLHMDLFQRLACDPASVCEVRFIDGKPIVQSVNVVPKARMV